jgi:hypothetical protein
MINKVTKVPKMTKVTKVKEKIGVNFRLECLKLEIMNCFILIKNRSTLGTLGTLGTLNYKL